MPPPPPRVKVGSEMSSLQDPLHVPHSFPPALNLGVTTEARTEQEMKESRSVSFQGIGRGRAYSVSESQPEAPQQLRRPRSQSLGAALTAGSVSYRNCDTIAEEMEGEHAEYDLWNPAA